jgi:hypothetical protein
VLVNSKAWKRKAQRFAEFFITLLIPWDPVTHIPTFQNSSNIGWTMLCNWSNHCVSDSASFIDRGLYEFFKNTCTLRNNTAQMMLNNFRARNAKKWTEEEKMDPDVVDYLNSTHYEYDDENRLIVSDGSCIKNLLDFMEQEIIRQKAEDGSAIRIKQTVAELDAVFGKNNAYNRRNPASCADSANIFDVNAERAYLVHASLKNNMEEDPLPQPEDEQEMEENQQNDIDDEEDYPPDEEDYTNNERALPCTNKGILPKKSNKEFQLERKEIDIILSQSKLTPDQLKIINDILENNATLDQSMEWLLGGPGTGKSYLLKVFAKCFKKGAVRFFAYTGIASIQLGNDAMTLHAGFKLPLNSKNLNNLSKESTIIEFRESFKNVIFIVIDEVSMLDAQTLYLLDKRLRAIHEDFKHLPYGGKSIILCGDFQQLPPVGRNKKLLIKDMLHKLHKDNTDFQSPIYHGVAPLTKFHLNELTVIIRSRLDKEHSDMINDMRNTDIDCPLTNKLCSKWKALSINDANDQDWQEAVVVTTNNKLRRKINLKYVQMFAKANNVPILKFKKPVESHLDVTAELTDLGSNGMYDLFDELWSYFVFGAPCLLTCTINNNRNLSNGMMGYMYSLTYDDNNDIKKKKKKNSQSRSVDDILRMNNMNKYNNEEHIVNIPLSVNIRMLKDNLKNIVETDCLQIITIMNDKTHVDEEWCIIPIFLNTSNKQYAKTGPGVMPIGYIQHCYDLAFAVTFYKLQSLTIPRLILDYNSYPHAPGVKHLTLADVFVGCSRVECLNNMRIVPLHIKENADKSNKNIQTSKQFAHLNKKKRNFYYRNFKRCFDSSGYFDPALIELPYANKIIPSSNKKKESNNSSAVIDNKNCKFIII